LRVNDDASNDVSNYVGVNDDANNSDGGVYDSYVL
jgi:hypothetical protein